MSNQTDVDDFGAPQLYNFYRQGSFGVFKTRWSFPLEFFQTTVSVNELGQLTLARELDTGDDIDFDMLLQRDIDFERITEELEPYLSGGRPSARHDHREEGAVFFPPLLVAIVPVLNKKIQTFYTNERLAQNNQRYWREWEGNFKIQYIEDKSIDAYTLTSFISGEPTPSSISVRRTTASMELRLAGDTGEGTKLVVIDGQHRLVALRKLKRDSPGLLNGLAIPVCLIYAPQATQARSMAAQGTERIPSVPEVFRKLFVDVNSTMRLVSGHFSILLNDISVDGLTCRRFCDFVLRNEGLTGLAAIEWNTKNPKESKDITKEYTLTSIGVLGPSMKSYLAHHIDYLLNLDEVKEDLFPADDEDHALSWERLTLYQRPYVEQQIEKYLVPNLARLFFEVEEFQRIFRLMKDEISKVEGDARNAKSMSGIAAQTALRVLLEYKPLPEDSGEHPLRALTQAKIREFESAVKARRETASVRPIVTRTQFQRAMIEALGSLISTLKSYNPPLDGLFTGFVRLLNDSLKSQGSLFQVSQSYLQYIVFSQGRIIVNTESRKALCNLIIANLGKRALAESIANDLKLNANEAKRAMDWFIEQGEQAASKLVKQYQFARTRAFERGYYADLSIPTEKRDYLKGLEDLKDRDRQRAKTGEIDESEISDKFDLEVRKNVSGDVQRAKALLQQQLGFEFVTEASDDASLEFDE